MLRGREAGLRPGVRRSPKPRARSARPLSTCLPVSRRSLPIQPFLLIFDGCPDARCGTRTTLLIERRRDSTAARRGCDAFAAVTERAFDMAFADGARDEIARNLDIAGAAR